MATPVVMPKLGNTVESCIIVEWKKTEGDSISEGEPICEVETDKAMVEVESPASGTLLAIFFPEGEEVAVMTNIAAIGEAGEDVSSLRPDGAAQVEPPPAQAPETSRPEPGADVPAAQETTSPAPQQSPTADGRIAISPRARNLAERQGLDPAGLQGSGPQGRIIERDVQVARSATEPLTPLARSVAAAGDATAPVRGTGIGGRVTAQDLAAAPAAPEPAAAGPSAVGEEVETIPLKGVRKVIAERMLASLQTTAQLTLNASADARALLSYRKKLKSSPAALDLQAVTINDLILFAVSRLLPQFPALNAHFADNAITRYLNAVHLGYAVDTPRGLMVPVIRQANVLTLQQIARESRRLATACQEGKITPDELAGGTFTVTNLGNLGIESFTPVLNPSQVAILGVNGIELKPVRRATSTAPIEEGLSHADVEFIPHIGLSLTINHQVVDGAPAARFLQAVAQGIADIDLLLAL